MQERLISQKTPNTMIYGELGRYPLYINTVTKSVKCCLRLVEIPDNRLPKAAYETVKSLDDKGVKTLAIDIRTYLFQYSFGFRNESETKRALYES